MKTVLALASFIAVATDMPAIDGQRLATGEACYAITMNDVPIGATYQSIKPVIHQGRSAWDIVVHQRAPKMSFDLRDHFIVDRKTLIPIMLESQRGTDRAARGWHHIVVRYERDRISGIKETASGTTQIGVPLDRPIWDGNLWGLTFAALPLREGGRYSVPFWQYDKGFGTFSVAVVGSQRVGRTDAWILEAGDDPARLTRYLIGKRTRAELGYSAGPSGQREGGDCQGLR